MNVRMALQKTRRYRKHHYLIRVDGKWRGRVDEQQTMPRRGVHEVAAVALPQRVQGRALVEVAQRGEVLHQVELRRVGLGTIIIRLLLADRN